MLDARKRGAVWKRPKVKKKVVPPADNPLAYLWQWYLDIRSGQGAGMGVNPLSHVEILSWNILYGVDADALDIDTIKQLDSAYMASLPKSPSPPTTG